MQHVQSLLSPCSTNSPIRRAQSVQHSCKQNAEPHVACMTPSMPYSPCIPNWDSQCPHLQQLIDEPSSERIPSPRRLCDLDVVARNEPCALSFSSGPKAVGRPLLAGSDQHALGIGECLGNLQGQWG